MSGRIEAIWKKRSWGGVMDAASEAAFVADEGVEGCASFGRSRRQVTVIEQEVFERIRGDLPDAEPQMRRANVMVSGLRLADSRGRILRLGPVRIRLNGETRPCERMDELCPGLRAALAPDWGGGAHGIVLDDGLVRVGDVAALEDADDGGRP